MMSESFVPLTDLERDALAELSNIAMARASNSLRLMIQNEVLLAVPSVEILTSAAATKLVAKPDNPKLVAVRQDFIGAFSGRALLIFPESNSLELVRAVVSRELPLEDIVDLEDEALAETGNIILNSWVATIANLLRVRSKCRCRSSFAATANTCLKAKFRASCSSCISNSKFVISKSAAMLLCLWIFRPWINCGP